VKEILAVIRMNMMNKTKVALTNAGVHSFTATGRVVGRGKGLVDFDLLQAASNGQTEAVARLGGGPRLVPKRIITVVVPDKQVDAAVDAIIQTNQTGHPGDGKIFILPVDNAHRVRTGEHGDKSL
jgi:nitrogen regulatory protein PII 2